MPGPWNDATDCQLLLTIIHLTGPTLPKWEQVAAIMGEGFTAESTRQHFQKLRKEVKAKLGSPDKSATTGTPAKGTPRKPKGGAKANVATPCESGRKKKRKAVVDEEPAADLNYHDDNDDDETPSKKRMVKAEDDGEGIVYE